MYNVLFTETSAAAIKQLHPDLKKAAKKAVNELKENPYCGKELQREFSGYYSYRFMRYRIVYKPDTQKRNIKIFIVCHREDVYENFSEYLRNTIK